jgi:hypothetical protein
MITSLIIGFIIYRFFRKRGKEIKVPVCDEHTNPS